MVVGKGWDKKKFLSGAPSGARKETQILRLWLTQYVCESENIKFKKKSNITYNAINNIWSFDRKYISY